MPSSRLTRQEGVEPLAFQEASEAQVYRQPPPLPNSNVIRPDQVPAGLVQAYHFAAPSAAAESRPALNPPATPTGSEPPQDAEPPPAASPAEDVQAACEELLQQARAEADRCLAAAQERAAAIEVEAYDTGFQQGAEAARAEAQARLAPVLAAFEQAVAEIQALRPEILRQAEADIVTLAFQIARKIIHHEASTNPELVNHTVRQALSRLMALDRVVVRVHPDDVAQAERLHDDLLARLGTLQQLTVQGDPTVDRGGCVVESALGEIDARLAGQCDELEQRLREHQPWPSEAQTS